MNKAIIAPIVIIGLGIVGLWAALTGDKKESKENNTPGALPAPAPIAAPVGVVQPTPEPTQ